jgi:hypothetical protein
MGIAAFGGRLVNASRVGWDAFRREFNDPTDQGYPDDPRTRRASMTRLWQYYANTVYEDPVTWRQYRAKYGLYRAQRSIYNPTRRLVEIYAGQLYPGVLSEDGKQLPDGIPLAIPLTDDTAPELKTAIAQFWQWSNWQANKSLFVRYGAIAGSVMVEAVDNLDRRNVTANVVWPGQVCYIDLDDTGNVKEYALEYRAYDDDRNEMFTFRKEVDTEVFRYYRDGNLYDYDGAGSEQANPYGFVPAVWVRHNQTGSDWGAPAIEGSLNKIDELNSLASHVHDQIHKKVAAPAVLSGVTSLRSLTEQQNRTQPNPDYTSENARVLEDREDLLLIGAPEGAAVHSLAGTLELDDALPYLEKLLGEIEQDHPELILYQQLRQMSQVTGPGASRLMGDAAARIWEAQATYDQQSVKLFGMVVAIAGWRLNSGAWNSTDRQREKFRPFDLGSYQRGDLDMAISPRPIMPTSQLERAQEEMAAAQAVGAYVTAGMSLEMAMQRVCGLNDEELAQFTLNQAQAIQRAQTLAQSDVPADPMLAAATQ